MKIIGHDLIAKHHPLPSSRKKNNKTVDWENTFHLAFHICFRNMKIEEIKLFIDIITQVDGRVWTKKKLQILRKDIMKRKVVKCYEVITKKRDNCKESGDLLQAEDVHKKY